MPTYRLTIEYDGTRFSGWQLQANTPKTIQGRLIHAATELFGKADVGGAGRTDAGVHAAGQVAHLKISRPEQPREIAKKLNDLLPHDISVLRVDEAHPKFHARHDALSRIYLYQISRRRTAFAKPFVWWIKDRLDLAAIREVMPRIVGKHDFTAFSDKRGVDESKIVVVEKLEIEEEGDLILVRITASHFLWKMVRKLIAAAVEIGRGNLTDREFATMLDEQAPYFQPSAPPSGLFLESVLYPGEKFDRPLGSIVPVHTTGLFQKPSR